MSQICCDGANIIVVREKWHHLGIYGLIEFSKPMNIKYYCDTKQWDTVTIEETLFNTLASNTSWPVAGIYSPWTIIYECREPID